MTKLRAGNNTEVCLLSEAEKILAVDHVSRQNYLFFHIMKINCLKTHFRWDPIYTNVSTCRFDILTIVQLGQDAFTNTFTNEHTTC